MAISIQPRGALKSLTADDGSPPQPTSGAISSSAPYEPDATPGKPNPATPRNPIRSVVRQPRNSDRTTPRIPTGDPHRLFSGVLELGAKSVFLVQSDREISRATRPSGDARRSSERAVFILVQVHTTVRTAAFLPSNPYGPQPARRHCLGRDQESTANSSATLSKPKQVPTRAGHGNASVHR